MLVARGYEETDTGITPVPGGKDAKPSIASTIREPRSVVVVKAMEVMAEPLDEAEDDVVDSSPGPLSVSEMLSGEGNISGVNQAGTLLSGTNIVPPELTTTGVATPPIIKVSGRRVPAGIDGNWSFKSTGIFSLIKVADSYGSLYLHGGLSSAEKISRTCCKREFSVGHRRGFRY